MGRSRAVAHTADDDPGQSRSKRKRTSSNVENLEFPTTGQVTSDGKKALYHCNYCNKDISGKIRFKCVMCPDFDLCVECFSVGAEITPHRSNHAYRVMDNLSFPLIVPKWNADEEILLLEGISMYGISNWAEVAEHVGTKSKSDCIDHYNSLYMNSPCFPLPDMSHVLGKNREELLAMAKEQTELKRGSAAADITSKEDPMFVAKIKVEEPRREAPAARSSTSLVSDVGSGMGALATGEGKKVSESSAALRDEGDEVKVEDRSIGEKKPRISGDDGPSLPDLSGYNPKRQEFEIEYDNDAEQLLADMEFKETDTEAERELKLRVLRIYSRRLDERKRRKDFILERNLLYPDPFEKTLAPEEREICHRYKVFMRFHTKEEHEELLRTVVEEHRIMKKIQDLKEARAAGCRTSAEVERYISAKRDREADENALHTAKESVEAGSGGKVLLRAKAEVVDARPVFLDSSGKDSSIAGPIFTSSIDEWDITGFPGADLLSESEKRLCKEMRILPSHYQNMLQILSIEAMKGNVSKKSDAHGLFKVDPTKVDRVYDMLVKKGIALQ